MGKRDIEVAKYENGAYVFAKKESLGFRKRVAIGTSLIVSLPWMVLAADDDVNKTFGNVHNAVLNAVDSGVVLVIIFAGASWMLGHRSKAISILIGVACGYLIISNAVNLRDFLKSI